VEEVVGLLRGVMDPELGGNIVDLGMAGNVTVTDDGLVTIGVKLTIGGCPLRAQIKKDVETRIETHPGVTKVKIDWGEMNADERSEVMLKARWNARENAPDTEIPATTRVLAIASGKGGVGKSSGHRQPGRRHRGHGLHGRRARRRHLGLLGAPHARRDGPPRGGEDRRRPRPHHPERAQRWATAC
jgi:metal-sulfur cluster biosynthetic enzyme